MKTDRTPDPAIIEATMLDLLQRRGAGKTICPSEVARAVVGEATGWREAMPLVRAVAGRLVRADLVVATQRGVPVDPRRAEGPIRLGLPQHGD